MELNFKTYGTGKPLLILHGLFGMLDNWSTLARKFGEHFQVFTIDLRNHGKSPHQPEMDYKTLAEDVVAFIEKYQLKEVHLIGHSMGGKVAMKMAISYPYLLDQLIIVDIGSKAYKGNHNSIFEAFNSLDLSSIENRKQADKALETILPEFSVRQFILKNLARNADGQYYWRPAVEYIHNNYTNILSAIEGAYEGVTLFIKGEKSSYILPEDHSIILQQFPQASITTIENAGHWVHAEQPIAIFETVKNFLLK